VTAGFPSPADDHIEGKLDLNALVARRPAATFYARASGESMTGAGIGDGDLLVVDRSLTPAEGDVVVAVIDGGLTVKRLERQGKGWRLAAANPAFQPLTIDPEDGVTIWGVVTYSLRRHCGREG
jgi:DNA polymerase V